MRSPLPLLPGVRSPDELVDLLVRHHHRRTEPATPAAPPAPSTPPVADAVAALGLGAKDLYHRARAHFEHLTPPEPRAAAGTTPAAPTQIEVRARAPAGGTAACLFHLDNDTPLTAKVSFRPSELRDGASCRWAHVRFSPPRLDIPPRGLGQVRVEVDLADEPPGAELTLDVEVHCKGHVTALVWLTLHVDPA
jgi:hypothetical protein